MMHTQMAAAVSKKTCAGIHVLVGKEPHFGIFLSIRYPLNQWKIPKTQAADSLAVSGFLSGFHPER